MCVGLNIWLCDDNNEAPGSIKGRTFSWLAEWLLASQEGLFSMELDRLFTFVLKGIISTLAIPCICSNIFIVRVDSRQGLWNKNSSQDSVPTGLKMGVHGRCRLLGSQAIPAGHSPDFSSYSAACTKFWEAISDPLPRTLCLTVLCWYTTY